MSDDNEDHVGMNGSYVSLKEHMNARFAAMDQATKLALETVKVASDNTAVRENQRSTQMISIVSLIVTIALGVYMLARHL